MYRQPNPSRTSPTASETSRLRLSDRYQPRQPGTGYGRSSGYASPRQYAQVSSTPLFRCS